MILITVYVLKVASGRALVSGQANGRLKWAAGVEKGGRRGRQYLGAAAASARLHYLDCPQQPQHPEATPHHLHCEPRRSHGPKEMTSICGKSVPDAHQWRWRLLVLYGALFPPSHIPSKPVPPLMRDGLHTLR